MRLVAVAFEAREPERLAAFWAALLGREAAGGLLPGSATQVGLRFVPGAGVRTGANRMHLHLTSADLDDQRAIVARALELGGCHLDVGQRPEEEHVVLGDPERNELCVIEPGNAYLAGCGPLAEVACDGTREVGVFWSEALGWPLVWDQDGETAIQSPAGGTKVAWGGAAPAPAAGRRQSFEVEGADVDRLLALGARRAGDTLTDPDGTPILLA